VTSPSPGTFTDGTNTLVFTSVQVVLRKIELERVGHDGACASGTSGESSGHDSTGHDGAGSDSSMGRHDCEELRVGPTLVDVPVAAGAQHTVSVNLDAGTFEKVEFEVHKAQDDSADAAFLAANPTFAGVSILVQGTWNGAAFTFTSDLDAKQEIELSPPLTVTQSGPTDLTLFFDVSSWFTASGGTLIDPGSAVKGQPNEGIVKDNITRSLRAFRDNDEDGAED
jgi:hypothetical protein